MKKNLIVLLGAGFFVISPHPCRAHDLRATIRTVGSKVKVEAFFDQDTSARDAAVSVFDNKDKIVAKGKTDKKGIWFFDQPKPGKYRVHVDAGGGHVEDFPLLVKSAGSDSKQVVSPTPSRDEQTQFPWIKIGIGVGVIAMMCLALLVAVRIKRG